MQTAGTTHTEVNVDPLPRITQNHRRAKVAFDFAPPSKKIKSHKLEVKNMRCAVRLSQCILRWEWEMLMRRIFGASRKLTAIAIILSARKRR